jgi:hypothetical protein
VTSHVEANKLLRTVLEATATPPTDGLDDYSIAASVGPALLARARNGATCLLIPIAQGSGGVGRRGGGFHLHSASVVTFRHRGTTWQQRAAILECTSPDLLDVFLILAQDVAASLRSRDEISWNRIVALVERWETLFHKRAPLTPERQLGLWGELWVLTHGVNVDLLVDAWRGPDGDPVDLFLDGIGMEIKTTRRARVHHISQRQADRPTGMHSAYLLSIWVSIEPLDGRSLPELVEALLASVRNTSALLAKLAEAGYSALDREAYIHRFKLLEPPKWFDMNDVPRVRTMDEGISELRYVVTLDPEKAIGIGEESQLADHLQIDFSGNRTAPSRGEVE